MSVYKSCSCLNCRHSPSNVKRDHKRTAHRMFRRLTRVALKSRRLDDLPAAVSTGYKY